MGNSIVRFLLGFFMFISGLYLLLNAIRVDMGNMFVGSHALYTIGGFGVTSGSIMIVLMIGIGFLFYDARKLTGWLITSSSLLVFILGVIVNTRFTMQHMSAFDLILILVLLCGGLGLLLSAMISRSI